MSGLLLASTGLLRTSGLRRLSAAELPGSPTSHGPELAVLLTTLGALYALYPTYFVLGGQDPGLYLLFAARIARTGGLDVDLPWAHRAWADTHGMLAPGYPGIYSLSELGIVVPGHLLSPQFMHLFPALAANAWAAGGLEATVRVNALVAILALACGYALVRRLASSPAGLAYVVALGLNPAFLWGARITLSELVALWLNLLGLLLLTLSHAGKSWRWALLGGSVLGAGVLARFDSGFAALAVLGFALGAGSDPARRKAARLAALGYLGLAALGFADGHHFAPGYFARMWQRHALGGLMLVSLGLGALALAWSLPRLDRTRLPGALERWLPRLELVALVGATLWLAAALLGHPLWHYGPTVRAATELTWYLTPLAWPLFLLGAVLTVRTGDPARWLPLLALAGVTTVLYTARMDVAHEHIWASRRWLPHVIPLVLLFAVVGAHGLLIRLGRFARPAAGLAGVVLAGYAALCLRFERPFLLRSMLEGLPDAYERFVSYVRASGPRLPLATTNVQLASILTYVYDVPTMLLGAKGYPRLAHGDLAGHFGVGFGPFELGSVTEYADWSPAPYLEITAEHPPAALIDLNPEFTLGPIGGSTNEVEVLAGHPSLGTLIGRRGSDGSLRTTGREGTLQNGPWITLTPGRYEVDWLGRAWSVPPQGPSGTLDVIARGGELVLASERLRLQPSPDQESWLGGLTFTLERPLAGVEFRLRVEAATGLILTRVRLRRVAVPSLDELIATVPPPPPP